MSVRRFLVTFKSERGVVHTETIRAETSEAAQMAGIIATTRWLRDRMRLHEEAWWSWKSTVEIPDTGGESDGTNPLF